jgi:4-hydroxy-3-polyprenylbenzoate decarboxylase
LLAIGSERYVPYRPRHEPQELLTQANAILGQGQMSLAKYVLICAGEDDPALDLHDIGAFFSHLLARVDFRRDLHFQTRTTIDTLDYSGHGLNQGSKLVIAAAGEPIRTLSGELPADLSLPEGFSAPRVCARGILAVQAPAGDDVLRRFCASLDASHPINRFPLVVLVDDSEFTARNFDNFLWVTFTRTNPAVDVDGIGAFVEHKHWGATGSLVLDARRKPHHAPPLIEDPAVTRRVDALAVKGGPLHGII